MQEKMKPKARVQTETSQMEVHYIRLPKAYKSAHSLKPRVRTTSIMELRMSQDLQRYTENGAGGFSQACMILAFKILDLQSVRSRLQ